MEMYDWDFYLFAITVFGLIWLLSEVLPKASKYSKTSKILITLGLVVLTYFTVSRIMYNREINEYFEKNPPHCSHVPPEDRDDCLEMYYGP